MTGALTRRPPAAFMLFVLALAVITGEVLFPRTAWAQTQPGLGGPAGGPAPGGAGPGQGRDKKEGPAEEAPEDKQALRPIEPVPAEPERRRRVQLFDVHGYMRLRADYFHRLDLGLAPFYETPEGVFDTKFFEPPAEIPELDLDDEIQGPNDAGCLVRLGAAGVSDARAQNRCNRRNGFASANMRLRFEPTLHITDTVKVHSQIDILDNVVLGSTPDSFRYGDPWAPIDLYARTQVPPRSDVNSWQDSIMAKRAWGQIRFGWGLDLRFGRMPWSWGMGMVANHGNGYYRGEQQDIIRYVDQDYGDSVDSVRFAFDFGKDRRRTHTVAFSWDWAASGPTTAYVLGQDYASGRTIGQAFSIERFDNVYQWSLSIERRDDPDMLRRKLSLGTPVVNWGLMTWWRYQDVDKAFAAPVNYFPETEPWEDDTQVLRQYSNRLVHRQAFLATPDFWARVNWRTLRVELELAGNFGFFRINDIDAALTNAAELADAEDVAERGYFDGLTRGQAERKIVASFGYALEFKYGFFQDRFHIGFDQGFAMGDNAFGLDGNPLSPLPSQGGDDLLTGFRMNPAYNIDLIMFREILGTVSNAAYFKPWAAFYFFDHFSARADVEYALAARPESTPGTDKWSYGVELDGALRYHDAREPIFFQVQYGVMFPLGAFNRVLPAVGEQPSRREDARAVQTVQAQVGIRF